MQTKFLVAFALFFIASTVSLGAPRLTITGKVVDSVGRPLSNATVMVYHAGVKHGYSTYCPSCYEDCGKRTTTDAAGSYSVEKLNPDLWFELLVVLDGYTPTFIKVADSSKNFAPTAVLVPRSPVTDPAHIVKGRVVDKLQNAIANAVVNPVGVEINEHSIIGTVPGLDPLAVTNANGEFDLVYANSAKRMLLSIEARTLAPKFVVLATGPNRQTIELSKGATIHGRLVKDGTPVGNAEVGLIGQTRGGFADQLKIVGTPYSEMRVGTQDDGSFTLSNVPPQINWFVYAKMESVATRGATEPKPCTTSLPGDSVNVGNLELLPGHQFQGRVLLSDGKSIPDGMRIIISSDQVWDSQTAVLDKDGRFSFIGLARGKYSLSPAVRGYGLQSGEYETEISIDRDVRDFIISLRPNPVAH